MRIMDLADELGVSTVTIVAVCQSLGLSASWAGAELSDEEADRVRQAGPPPPTANRQPGRYAAAAPGAAAMPGTPVGFGVPAPAPPAAPGTDPMGPSPAGFGGPAPQEVGGVSGLPARPPADSAAPMAPPPAPAMMGAAPAAFVPLPAPGAMPPTPPGAMPLAPPPGISPRQYNSGAVMPSTRRREPMVSRGWSLWWKAFVVSLLFGAIYFVMLLFIGATSTMRDAYDYGGTGGLNAPKIALLLVAYVVGLAYVALLTVQGASTALEGWNRITEAPHVLKGKLSIVWLVGSAVYMCVALASTIVLAVVIFIAAL